VAGRLLGVCAVPAAAAAAGGAAAHGAGSGSPGLQSTRATLREWVLWDT